MRVLVTGANGFLGSHVAEALAAQGHRLRFLLRRRSSLRFIEDLDYETAYGDVRDAGSLAAAMAGVDAVVHLAGLTSALRDADYEAINTVGSASVAHSAVGAGVKRLVYISSLAAQGPSPDGSTAMPQTARPVSAYGRTKLAGEVAVLSQDGLSTAVLRLPVVYGPRDRALLPLFKLIKLRLMPLFGDGSNQLSWVHVRDAATATAALVGAETAPGSIYTVADGPPHTWRELASLVGETFGHQPLMIPVPPILYGLVAQAEGLIAQVWRKPLPLSPEKIVEMRQRYWVCDSARIEADVGWRPAFDARSGIESAVRWYRENHWL